MSPGDGNDRPCCLTLALTHRPYRGPTVHASLPPPTPPPASRDFLVPRNFHESRFGPLSGLSHERRVIVAYYAGVLQPRDADAAWPAPVCRVCGDAGHRPDSCARAFCSDSVATPPPAAAGGDGSGRMHVRE